MRIFVDKVRCPVTGRSFHGTLRIPAEYADFDESSQYSQRYGYRGKLDVWCSECGNIHLFNVSLAINQVSTESGKTDGKVYRNGEYELECSTIRMRNSTGKLCVLCGDDDVYKAVDIGLLCHRCYKERENGNSVVRNVTDPE